MTWKFLLGTHKMCFAAMICFKYFVPIAVLINELAADEAHVTVKTSLGTFIGASRHAELAGKIKAYQEYLGIPYAKPPVGSLRFTRPVGWHNTFSVPYNATFYRSQCIQVEPFGFNYMKDEDTSEDCLYLNIYVPGDKIAKGVTFPVMVYIHGGSLAVGGSNIYTGDKLSAFFDVIVVTINYRLNGFGFLSDGSEYSGNYGLWDMVAAVKWVHEYICYFGGDNKRVTLFGNSAGSMAIELLALYSNNSDMFQRIITMSGSAFAYFAIQQGDIRDRFRSCAEKAGCFGEDRNKLISCLMRQTPEKLKTHSSEFVPIVDNEFITDDTSRLIEQQKQLPLSAVEQFYKLDLMSGLTSKEAGIFLAIVDVEHNGVPRENFVSHFIPDMLGRLYKTCPASEAVKQAVTCQYTDWTNRNDPFINMEKSVELKGDILFTYPSAYAIQLHAGSRINRSTSQRFFYIFHHKAEYFSRHKRIEGAFHSSELTYVSGLPKSFERRLIEDFYASDPLLYSEQDRKLARTMMRLWSNFAKTGDPNFPLEDESQNFPGWPLYELDSQQYLEISVNMTSNSLKHHYAASRVAFWTKLVPALRQEQSACTNQSVSVAYSAHHIVFLIICSTVIDFHRHFC